MAQDILTYQGVDVQKAYKTLNDAGIHAEVARQIIGVWIGEAAISSRHFGYSQTLTDAEAACSPPPFARSFAHQDWIDGESVVQAGETPTEKGFNDRFHRIEDDLDDLGELVARTFSCMNSVRATVAASLREIAAELNRLNADIADIRRALPSTKRPIGPVNKGLEFLGKTKYFDQEVLVFQDPEGRLVNLPDIAAVSYPPKVEPRAPKVAEVFGRDADIRRAFAGGVTKKEIIDKFGDRISSDGNTLGDMLVSLPDEETFPSLDAMVEKLADQDIALIKGLGAEAQMRGSVGVAAGAAVSTAPVERVEGVTPQLGQALSAAGVATIADLKNLSPSKIVEIGRARGVDVSLGAASGLLARGKVLGGL